jgi:hypothetical protein
MIETSSSGGYHMVVKFSRRRPGQEPAREDAATVNSLPPVSQRLLDKHAARVLSPSDAVAAAGWPAPRATVYRTGVLLIPADIVNNREVFAVIQRILARIGLEAVVPGQGGDTKRPFQLDTLPLPVALRVRAEAPPTVVDSWTALQYLRAATAGKQPELERKVVTRISVEHLLFTNPTIGGVPWDVSGLSGTPWDVSGISTGASYGRSRTGNRIPVALSATPPPRRDLDPSTLARRPVVAVLDTGIAPHPWFDLPDRTNPPPAGGFLAVAPDVQDAILQAQLATGITVPTQLLSDHWDAPSTDEPLIGDIDTDTGHGIFIAGVLRQAAPDVDTLAIRCVHSDGVAYEADVLLALTMLSARVQAAQQNQQPDDMIDVLSLSLGYFDETPADAAYTSQLSDILAELTGLGVVVLAAAGNSATSRRFYPAAFADQPPVSGGGPQVISVGALNPNGSKALFSNEAPWVHAWATGAGVVSTYPTDVRGSSAADHELPDQNRNGLDPDDYTSGFAVWDGTSFAAPLAAAALANALISVAANDSVLSLLSVDQTTAVKRAWAALALV